jgi:hypothetical protein
MFLVAQVILRRGLAFGITPAPPAARYRNLLSLEFAYMRHSMSKRIRLILILVLSHSAVAALTFTATWYWMQQGGNSQVKPTKDSGNSTASAELKLERFVKDMRPYAGGREAGVRGDLLLTLQAAEQLEPSDRQLLTGLKPDEVANHELAELQCVRSFLDSYSNPQNVNAFVFTSERNKPLLKGLLGEPDPTPKRVLAARKQVRQLAESFLTLRKKALTLPYTEIDDRLHFLEMLRDLASENYSDAKMMSEPILPFLNDREGLVLSSLEKWLNSRHARQALPIEQFARLYRDGKVQPCTPAFASYLARIKAQVSEEQAKAKESQGAAKAQLADAYSAVETFFTSLADLSGSAS